MRIPLVTEERVGFLESLESGNASSKGIALHLDQHINEVQKPTDDDRDKTNERNFISVQKQPTMDVIDIP